MKKLLSTFSVLSLIIPSLRVANANEYKFLKSEDSNFNGSPSVEIYGISANGSSTFLNRWQSSSSGIVDFSTNIKNSIIDEYTGKIYVDTLVNVNPPANDYTVTLEYDLVNNTFKQLENISNNSTQMILYPKGITQIISEKSDGSIQIGGDTDDIDVVSDGLNIEGAAVITKNADGSIQIGSDTNDIDITAEGLNMDGNPLITKKDNGEIHIGKNSLITKSEEETLSDGTKVQPLYAKDADGNKIPINIDGSKLLIDGVEVTAGGDSAQVTTNKNNISTNTSNIKNLGEGVAGTTALTAALTALPQTSKESKLSCGVGTGAYSSKYALGFGCASKVNERVDINAGGSYVFGGSKSYGEGTLDSGVIKAGFVFKLGELNKSQKISKTETENLESKIGSLEEKNKQLLARLERLEKVALGEHKSQDLAVYKVQ